jgi:hypothetical protein
MMEKDKKVVAAIATALHLYMQSQQQAAFPADQHVAPEPPRTSFSAWAMSGRQSAMEMRRFMQMRLVR